jgi:hypothetical protein
MQSLDKLSLAAEEEEVESPVALQEELLVSRLGQGPVQALQLEQKLVTQL